MFLALKEIRRAIVRFTLLTISIGLLMFLILFQQTLQNGLLVSFVGAIENQSAPVLVYSVDGRRTLQASVVPPPLEEQVTSVDGVAAAGRIGQGTFTVRAGGELSSVAILGYEDPDLGAPTTLVEGRLPESAGEVVALDSAAEDGFGIGERVEVVPGGLQLEVVGLAERIGLQVTTTLFTRYDSYEQVVRAANPDASGVLPSVIAVASVDGVSDEELAQRINDEVADADALVSATAAAETPGVAQVRQSFQLIFLLYSLVVPLVTGLFFLIITLQKSGSLTLLRAVGAPAGALVRSLLLQVGLVLVGGLGVGIALYTPVANQRLGGIPLSFETGAVVFWTVTLLVLGLVSSLVAARRVLRIDPIEATTGGGLR